MSDAVKFIPVKNNKDNKLIISFSGQGGLLGQVPVFEFLKFLHNNKPDVDKLFIIDKHRCWYQKGIENRSTDIESTVEFLRKKIQNYKEVIFIGASSGGYAAILFGSLLSIKKVIAFFPQTNLEGILNYQNKKYFNLKQYINKKTKYYLYADYSKNKSDRIHHTDHCFNLSKFKNVKVKAKDNIDLKQWRYNGLLEKYLIKIIDKKL